MVTGTRALVVGYGSVGVRHTRLLMELGVDTAVCSRRDLSVVASYKTLAMALSAHRPDYVVIANEPATHLPTLNRLAELGFVGDVLVEKPLFDRFCDAPQYPFRNICVGYNLRFHPALRWLKEFVAKQDLLTLNGYVGQYLPSWRPERDYRDSYSASKASGGGVLRDLSHELDYIAWICGKPQAVTALGGKISSLQIDSDDVFALLLQSQSCPVISLQLSYLDRVPTRRILVTTREHSVQLDLLSGCVHVDGRETVFQCDRDLTYRTMHQALLSGDQSLLCSFQEGLNSMRLIEVAEQASECRAWVNL